MKLKVLLLLMCCLLNKFSYSVILNDEEFNNRMQAISSMENDADRFFQFSKLYESGEDYQRFVLLPIISKEALELNKNTEAEKFAKELLSYSEKYPDDWNYGNAIHVANIVIGSIFLSDGNVEEAKHHLLKAGNVKSSPQLSTFGPDLRLANKLLKLNERSTVIAYLKSCKLIWSNDKGRLDDWIALIEIDRTPQLLKY